MKMSDPIRIGVSSCLLGQKVRYDGGHKRDPLLTDLIARYVEFVPSCPELEMGLGVPRESIHLARVDGQVRLLAPRSGRDLTDDMRRWSEERLRNLEPQSLSGYILKKDSPSCGMERVRIHGSGSPSRDGVGVFAEALLRRWPLLPVEEEGRLNDPRLRENFIERVFAYHRLAGLFVGRWSAADVVRFHTSEKLLLLAHHPEAYRELGRLVARVGSMARAEFAQKYREGFMAALKTLATARRHTNVLQHAAGYLREAVPESDRRELALAIEDYRRGLVPLVAPMVLLRSHVRARAIAYLAGQTYLSPHPKELMLRNHV